MKFSRLLLVLLLLNLNLKSAEKCIKLDSGLLGVIDGVRNLMDGDKIWKMLYLGQQLNQFMYGNLDASQKRVPQHLYKGKFYTLEQLVKIEEQLEESKLKDPTVYQKDKAEIATTLEKLKEMFLGFTTKVLAENRGADEQTYAFIDDFISKYGDSILKYWRIDKDATSSLHLRVTSFKLCFVMSFDLYHFLKAMICSCPKALQMYKAQQQAAVNRSAQITIAAA